MAESLLIDPVPAGSSAAVRQALPRAAFVTRLRHSPPSFTQRAPLLSRREQYRARASGIERTTAAPRTGRLAGRPARAAAHPERYGPRLALPGRKKICRRLHRLAMTRSRVALFKGITAQRIAALLLFLVTLVFSLKQLLVWLYYGTF